MVNSFLKVISIVLIVFFWSCTSSEEKSIDQATTVKTEKGEIISVSGTRQISGIYPHLTTYAHARENGTYSFGNECGIGALAVWNEKLYMINYAAHEPKGSEHKLYIIDKDKNMQVFQGSIGGTPAARMIHKESNQLLIGPYVISSSGEVRVIPNKEMKGRLTAIARHLKDPENLVYYYDMEGMLYEVNVHTLKVKKLYHNPLPGWHGKGAYTSQNKLVLANNGEHGHESSKNWKITLENQKSEEDKGILAEFDGENFKVIERRQFTDVTTKNGINAVPNEQSPLWSMGWDKRSIRLKVLEKGKWKTFLLPKAAYNNDPSHGWFTEWPRIREIGNGKMMMDMHGMFYDFPETFSHNNTAGIKPMGSHLRYIPDFLSWNNMVVLATDETSIQGNPYAGQPQSNLWFGTREELTNWGPKSAYGAIWLNDEVVAKTPSLPFLIAGFDNRILHLNNLGEIPVTITIQIDEKGTGDWKELQTTALEKEGYNYYIFKNDLKAEWVRLVTDKTSKLTAAFHFTDQNLKNSVNGAELFKSLADINETGKVSHTKLYSNKINYNLSVYAGEIENNIFKTMQSYEFLKYDFKFVEGIKDSSSVMALKNKKIGEEVEFYTENSNISLKATENEKEVWTEDAASIILHAKEYQLRLPKGNANYSKKFSAKATRVTREVESERELANISGTFYELPIYKVGKEPLYKMMRPVATHNKQITEFNTWNGLLVLSGVKMNAKPSEHVYKSDDGNVALWFGGIDDLWSLGKPVGEGGPWKNTQVKANQLSDMYLMTGYDEKTVILESDVATDFELYIHINHYSKEPVLFKTFQLKAGEKITYKFPEGFSAHWAQLKSSKDCNATAWFIYK
ncbi:hypothetical protein MKD41_09640 [Lutibacter sp. A64]|uniref:hypothetical protein n=1 Tax=Lutibacter sp. A64 TaxID=2918526 RepID=UPI001F06019F|nr:hypothetical protein [Lutibacter sp. A64]UMB52598.1 hypothetical protein MKD41_09640 [Lutibacter sp. A64]